MGRQPQSQEQAKNRTRLAPSYLDRTISASFISVFLLAWVQLYSAMRFFGSMFTVAYAFAKNWGHISGLAAE